MKIEISIDGEEPVSYPLADRMTVGADETCTISINSREISLIHVEVVVDEGKIYVIDQGSRNGSFIDDTRLEPKTRHEIKPYVAVRLGASILLTLVPETEKEKTGFIVNPIHRQAPRQSDKTVTISKVELEKASTKKLVKKKVKKKSAAKKKNSFLLPLLLLLVAGGVAYWKFVMVEETPVPVAAIETPSKPEVIPAKPAAPEKDAGGETFKPLAPEEGAADPFKELVENPGCPGEVEKKICEGSSHSITSARIKDSKLYVLIDSNKLMPEATKIAEKTAAPGASTIDTTLDTVKIAMTMFIAGIKDFPYEELGEKEIIFRNARKFPMRVVLTTVINTTTSKLKSVKERLTPEVITAIGEKGSSELDFTKDYFEIVRNQGLEYKTQAPAEPSTPAPTPTPTPAPTN